MFTLTANLCTDPAPIVLKIHNGQLKLIVDGLEILSNIALDKETSRMAADVLRVLTTLEFDLRKTLENFDQIKHS